MTNSHASLHDRALDLRAQARCLGARIELVGSCALHRNELTATHIILADTRDALASALEMVDRVAASAESFSKPAPQPLARLAS